MSGPIAVGTGLAIAGNRHIDQTRVDHLQSLITQPQPLHHPGTELLQDDVMLAHQVMDHRHRFGLLQVQGQAALVAIEPGVAGGNVPVVGRPCPQQVQACG